MRLILMLLFAGQVACAGPTLAALPAAAALCGASSSSSLPGVTIVFTGSTCQFTLAAAAAGLSIPYEIRVTEAVAGVVPAPQDAGSCGQPGGSGLTLFESLGLGATRYSISDTGLCPGIVPPPTALPVGVYPAAFLWDGRAWSGPSDTMRPKGDPFPPGVYPLRVRAIGTFLLHAKEQPFEVLATLPVTLTQ